MWCSGGRIFLAVCAVQVAAFYTSAEVPSYPFNIQLFAGFCLRLSLKGTPVAAVVPSVTFKIR